jgi:hypothetical protein
MSIDFGAVNKVSENVLPRQIAIGDRVFSGFMNEVQKEDYSGDMRIVKKEPGKFFVETKVSEEKMVIGSDTTGFEEEKEIETTTKQTESEEKVVDTYKQKPQKKNSVIPGFYAYNIVPFELRDFSIRTFDSIKNFLRDAAMQVEKLDQTKQYRFRFKASLPLEISIKENNGVMSIVLYSNSELKDELMVRVKELLIALQQTLQRETVELSVVDIETRDESGRGQGGNKEQPRIECFEEDADEDETREFQKTLNEKI